MINFKFDKEGKVYELNTNDDFIKGLENYLTENQTSEILVCWVKCPENLPTEYHKIEIDPKAVWRDKLADWSAIIELNKRLIATSEILSDSKAFTFEESIVGNDESMGEVVKLTR